MAEPTFSRVAGGDSDDDLPRTLRREREAQARRAREHALEGAAEPTLRQTGPAPAFQAEAPEAYDYDDFEPAPAAVTRINVPFFHLMAFFLKAVIAAIPALILLVAILWGLGELLTQTFPELVKMQVLIRMPN